MLTHTLKTFSAMIEYLLNTEKFHYVLPGRFQTDNLELRFSQYRQLSGGNYNVSVRQIMESEKKLKLIGLLHLKSAKCGTFCLREFSAEMGESEVTASSIPLPFQTIFDECSTIMVIDQDLPSVVFIAGYIAHKLVTGLSCHICKQVMF